VDLAEYFNRRSLEALARHDWPGNAREIAIVARRAHLALNTHGRVLVSLARHGGLPLVVGGPGSARLDFMPELTGMEADGASERSRLLLAIEEHDGNRALVARTLGISRSTLYRKLARLGIATQRD
jgi:transcriptional regulator of acetoin/glycerol metabolism